MGHRPTVASNSTYMWIEGGEGESSEEGCSGRSGKVKRGTHRQGDGNGDREREGHRQREVERDGSEMVHGDLD